MGIVFIAWQLPLLLKSVNIEFIQNKIFLQIDWENDLINIYQNLLYIKHCVSCYVFGLVQLISHV